MLSSEIDTAATDLARKQYNETMCAGPGQARLCHNPGVATMKNGAQVELLLTDTLVNQAGDLYFVNDLSNPRRVQVALLKSQRTQRPPQKTHNQKVAWTKRLLDESSAHDVLVLNTGLHHKEPAFYEKTIDKVLVWLKVITHIHTYAHPGSHTHTHTHAHAHTHIHTHTHKHTHT
jgi:hypothetical protein